MSNPYPTPRSCFHNPSFFPFQQQNEMISGSLTCFRCKVIKTEHNIAWPSAHIIELNARVKCLVHVVTNIYYLLIIN